MSSQETVQRSLYPSEAELRTAYQRACGNRIPHVPDVLLQLQTEIARDEPNVRRVADLIGEDPALTGSLLRTVNSAAFGASVELENVHQAVVRLGLPRVANLVTAELIGGLVDDGSAEVRQVWEEVREVARIALLIAREVEGIDPDEAYLFGMLHDVGSILFARMAPGSKRLRDMAAVMPVNALRQEQARLGTDHVTVGFLFARHWRLPEYFCLAVYHHHALSCAGLEDPHVRSLIAIIKLANYLASTHLRDMEMPEMVQYRAAARRELMLLDSVWEQLRQEALA